MAALAASAFQKLERNAGKDSTLVDAVPSYTLRGEITLDKAQISHTIPVIDSFSAGLKRVVGVTLTPLNQIASNIVGDKIGPFFGTGFPVASDAITATTPDISAQASNPSFAIQITGYLE
jgi:hypothetical protein